MRYSDTVSVFYQGSEKKDNVQQPNLLQENFQEKQELIFFFIKNLKVWKSIVLLKMRVFENRSFT